MSDSATPWTAVCQPPCPSPTPRVYSDSCPLHWWCHPTTSSSVIPFSSHPQSFPASGFFSNESALCSRWSKYWSFSFSISPSNEHSGLISFRIDWFDLLADRRRDSEVFSSTTVQKHQFFSSQPSLWSNSHIHTTTGKTIVSTIQSFAGKMISLLFNTLSRFVIAFLPRSKHLLICGCSHCLQWFWSPRKENLSLFPHAYFS